MEESRDDLSSQIRQLRLELADLRRRIESIEGLRAPQPAAEQLPAPILSAGAGATHAGGPSAEALAPLFGWAFLGLSGAYLLRGATESGALPVLAGVTAGILYAGCWLFLAARRASESPIAGTVHAFTAVLILTPLLWEATIRFRAITATVASAVLVAFTVFGLAIGWRHKITAIASAATLAGFITSTALFRETHDALAWAATVLAIAAAVEFSACRDHWLGLRWAAALTADFTVLVLTSLATQGAARQTVAIVSGPLALAAQTALLCLYLASTADRTLVRRLPITEFEIAQAIAAFVAGIGGALYLGDLTSVGMVAVGLVCLGCSVSCYVISFAVATWKTGSNRNFLAYSTFAVALMIIACRVLLSGEALAVVWAAVAPGLVYAGLITGRLALRLHGVLLLTLATFASGAIRDAVNRYTQNAGSLQSASAAVWAAVLVSAAACYGAMILFKSRSKVRLASSAESLGPAAIALLLGSSAAAQLVSHLPVGGAPLRTAVLTAFAIGAARLGVTLRQTGLSWISYLLVALAGVRIFIYDFPHGGSLGIFISLTLFGGTLILLPRLSRVPRPTSKAAMAAGA